MHRDGVPWRHASDEDGVALSRTLRSKQRTYPELFRCPDVLCAVLAMEVGGRWDEKAYEFLVELAKAKAQEAPKVLRGAATHSWLRRWVAILSKAGMDSFVSTLLYEDANKAELWNSMAPPLGAVLCAAPEPPEKSRMGPR